MSDGRFDGAAPPDVTAQALCDAALELVVVSLRARRHVRAAIAKIDKDLLGLVVGQDLHLLQRFEQGVTIVGIARHGAHAHYQPFLVRDGDGHLHAEFIRLACFALGDAFRFRRVQAIECILVALPLRQQAFDFGQQFTAAPLERFGCRIQLALHIAPHAANKGLELLQAPTHALELFGMGIFESGDLQFAPQTGYKY